MFAAHKSFVSVCGHTGYCFSLKQPSRCSCDSTAACVVTGARWLSVLTRTILLSKMTGHTPTRPTHAHGHLFGCLQNTAMQKHAHNNFDSLQTDDTECCFPKHDRIQLLGIREALKRLSRAAFKGLVPGTPRIPCIARAQTRARRPVDIPAGILLLSNDRHSRRMRHLTGKVAWDQRAAQDHVGYHKLNVAWCVNKVVSFYNVERNNLPRIAIQMKNK